MSARPEHLPAFDPRETDALKWVGEISGSGNPLDPTATNWWVFEIRDYGGLGWVFAWELEWDLMYLLNPRGAVWTVDAATGTTLLIFDPKDFEPSG